jgi:hypothetical protein
MNRIFEKWQERRYLLKGSRVDGVIKDLAGVLDPAPSFYEYFMATNTKYPTGEALQEVIWRTSIANWTTEGRRAPEEYGRQYELLKKQLFGHVVDYLISHPIYWTSIWIFQFVKLTTDKLLWLPMIQLLRCGYFWTSLAFALLIRVDKAYYIHSYHSADGYASFCLLFRASRRIEISNSNLGSLSLVYLHISRKRI